MLDKTSFQVHHAVSVPLTARLADFSSKGKCSGADWVIDALNRTHNAFVQSAPIVGGHYVVLIEEHYCSEPSHKQTFVVGLVSRQKPLSGPHLGIRKEVSES